MSDRWNIDLSPLLKLQKPQTLHFWNDISTRANMSVLLHLPELVDLYSYDLDQARRDAQDWKRTEFAADKDGLTLFGEAMQAREAAGGSAFTELNLHGRTMTPLLLDTLAKSLPSLTELCPYDWLLMIGQFSLDSLDFE